MSQEGAQDMLVGAFAGGGVAVPAQYAGGGKELAHLLFDALRARAEAPDMLGATFGADGGRPAMIVAAVAQHQVHIGVPDQRHVAVAALGHMAAGPAEDEGATAP